MSEIRRAVASVGAASTVGDAAAPSDAVSDAAGERTVERATALLDHFLNEIEPTCAVPELAPGQKLFLGGGSKDAFIGAFDAERWQRIAVEVEVKNSRSVLHYQIPLRETVSMMRDRVAADIKSSAALVALSLVTPRECTKLSVRHFDATRVVDLLRRSASAASASTASSTSASSAAAASSAARGGEAGALDVKKREATGEAEAVEAEEERAPMLVATIMRFSSSDTQLHVASPLVGRGLGLKERRAMQDMLSEDRSNFDLLFTLIALTERPVVVARAWALLRRVPVNDRIQEGIETLGGRIVAGARPGEYSPVAPPRPRRQDGVAGGQLTQPTPWAQLLDGTATLQLLYSLRLLNAMTAQTDRLGWAWSHLFVACGGRQHLLRLLDAIDVAAYLRTPLFTRCFEALLVASAFFLKMDSTIDPAAGAGAEEEAEEEFDANAAAGVVRVLLEVLRRVPRTAAAATEEEEEEERCSWSTLVALAMRLVVVATRAFGSATIVELLEIAGGDFAAT